MPTTEQQFVTQLRELVTTCSISSPDPSWDTSNRGVIHTLATFAEAAGFDVQVQALDANPNGKANLVARLGPARPEEPGIGGLVLSGHTDTVPYDEGLWTADPLKVTERDQKLFGLGSADMKGFFPLALAAVAEIQPSQLRAPIYLLATADEESTMRGARSLPLEALGGATAAVIGEPTNLQPIRLHKGIMMQGVRLRGRSGHSSDPSLGNNVIDSVPALLALLDEYRQQLASEFRCELLAVPSPTINFGCLHGGDSPNRICGEIDLSFDVRMLPGLAYEEVEADLTERLESLAASRGIDIEMRRLVEPVPAFEQAADSEAVRAAERVSGQPAGAVNFATEAPFLQRLGLETVVLGAGSIEVAHQPDEYLPLDQLRPGIEVIKGLIAHHCS
ncbi:MAG: acetylornithine deacetylase [Cellvibrionales bacterium]|jgi:acetylornithine deacetylase